MRFRLKTEFLTYAHDQIRGGLWYKPTWWEAVQKVPPTAVLPRLKKKFIPRIHFVEDRLMREFSARNPTLRHVDARNYARGRPNSVASEFVAEQLRHMRADRSEPASFDAAQAWLVENGPRVLKRVDARLLGDSEVPAEAVPPADIFSRAMSMQSELLRSALKAEEALRRGSGGRALPPHRTFLAAPEIASVALRMRNREAPAWPSRAAVAAGGAEDRAAAASEEAAAADEELAGSAEQPAVGKESVLASGAAEEAVVADLLRKPAAAGADGKKSS